ncbi:MAG: hypothetical protein GY754_01380 [bacterium]|nr:hypothetical protein [bacterium]
MEVNTGLANIAESTQRMGDLLKNMTSAQLNIADKMTKINVTAQVEGLGENLDVKA